MVFGVAVKVVVFCPVFVFSMRFFHLCGQGVRASTSIMFWAEIWESGISCFLKSIVERANFLAQTHGIGILARINYTIKAPKRCVPRSIAAAGHTTSQ